MKKSFDLGIPIVDEFEIPYIDIGTGKYITDTAKLPKKQTLRDKLYMMVKYFRRENSALRSGISTMEWKISRLESKMLNLEAKKDD